MNTAIAAVQPDQSSVSGLRPHDAHHVTSFAAWKDFVHDNFPWLEHRNHSRGRFDAQVCGYQFAGSTLSTIRVDASEVIRTRRLADASESGFIKMVWTAAGQLELEQDKRQCLVKLGQVAVCDTARPYRIRVSEGTRFVVLMMPYSTFPEWQSSSQRICGKSLVDNATTRAAVAALMSLTSFPTEAIESEGETIIRAVQWMLSISLHRTCDNDSDDGFRDARMCKAKRYVFEHMADPDLNANDIASAICMSRRALYTLFSEHEVTPSKMINNIRLDRVMLALVDPQQRHRKITDLAFDFGYSDYATFSRVFKARFGRTPSESRLKDYATRPRGNFRLSS